ncbi:polysaccharide pyruvyl transferase family protein [Rhodococcus sp. p52]|uniref:polysaccharide pyruvyl transferase family protein n=1 Tax=Rhodococcus sp. p52 TaxID=935199 RepID=UPI0012F51507|nr:polysaccharide pyruvyl transferase family protein [Rhodococcus sp. p52]
MSINAQRIGILTLTQSENYGTVLQAYATHQLFDTAAGEGKYSLVPTDVAHVRRRRFASVLNPKNPSFGLARVRNFAAMRRFVAPYTYSTAGKRWVDINDRNGAIDYLDAHFDGFVTGSDEVWNLAFVGDRSIYYAPESLGRVRASFATSANRLDISKLSRDSREILRRSLSSYAYISVRDANTSSFVRELLEDSVDIDEIVDPTLIHGLPEFVVPYSPSARFGRKKVLLMVRDRKIGEALISHLRDSVDINTVFIRYPGARFLQLDPIQFAGVFGQYDCVVTDFFHGTCMSTLSQVPFVSFDSEPLYSKYESKIKNLLSKLGMEERYVNLTEPGDPGNYRTVLAKVEEAIAEPPAWTAQSAVERERRHGLTVLARIKHAVGEGLAEVG